MNFFEKFGFLEDEQKEYEDITPEEIKKMISKHNKLVETNLQFLKDLEINTYKEIFINYPDMLTSGLLNNLNLTFSVPIPPEIYNLFPSIS